MSTVETRGALPPGMYSPTSELVALDKRLQSEVSALNTSFDAANEALDEIVIRAKSTNIHVPLIGLVWMPYRSDENRRLRPAWN